MDGKLQFVRVFAQQWRTYRLRSLPQERLAENEMHIRNRRLHLTGRAGGRLIDLLLRMSSDGGLHARFILSVCRNRPLFRTKSLNGY